MSLKFSEKGFTFCFFLPEFEITKIASCHIGLIKNWVHSYPLFPILWRLMKTLYDHVNE